MLGGVSESSGSPLDDGHMNFENLCAHQQEEILKIPKHPQKSTFWWVLAKKIEVEVGNPHLESDSEAEKWFLY